MCSLWFLSKMNIVILQRRNFYSKGCVSNIFYCFTSTSFHFVMKKSAIYPFFLITLAFSHIACEKKVTHDDTNPNEKIIKTFYEHFNKHEWEKMASMYADTADFKDPSLGKNLVKQTRKQTAEKYAELNQIFPDIKDEVVQMYPSGEKHVIVEFISSGTAADKSTFRLPICTIFKIENGLITEDFTYYDNSK